MSDLAIVFSNPWLLFLLIPALLCTLIPFFLIPARFRRSRNRVISVVLHSLAVTLCVLLIAGTSFTFTVPNRENELLLVVDRSDSGSEQEELKEKYIQNVIGMCDVNYKVGIVTFGYDTVYAAPLSYDSREVYRQYLSAELPDTSATDIAGALTFAAEQFANPRTAKIVLLSDGFETDSSALNAAQIIAAQGIRIDTVHFGNEAQGEIQLVDAQLPGDKVVLGAETEVRLTVESNIEMPVSATVTVSDMGFEDEAQSVTIDPGVQTIVVPHVFQSEGMHDILVELACASDFVTQNNVFQTYLDISAFEDILILENVAGEANELISILSEGGYTADVLNIHTDAAFLPQNAKELCAYEQVVLVNISNADLQSPAMPAAFDRALYDYVYSFGGSLFTVGGSNDAGPENTSIAHAYNREDLQGTLLQEMLPVQAIDYSPPIAVMIVIDTSGSMSSGRFDMAISGALETVDALNDRDFCGVMSFDTNAQDQVEVLPASQREEIRTAIERLRDQSSSGTGGTVFSGAIDRAGRALGAVDADRKHIILITDGNPADSLDGEGTSYGKYIDYNRENGITMSVIAVGMSSGNRTQMENTAERGGGNFHNVPLNSPAGTVGLLMQQDLAEITLSETEDIEFVPVIGDHTSIFTGIDTTQPFPVLNGYYGTRVKDGAVVPLLYEYVPIYAAWNFGAGSVGSFLCDLSGIRSEAFIADGIGRQLVRNICESLAPLQPPEPDRLDFNVRETTQNYSTRLDVYTDLLEGERVQVTVEALSADAGIYYNGGVPVTSYGNNVSFDFEIVCTGVYRICIEKLDAAGNVVSDIFLYRTFSYSDEYDVLRDGEEGAQLLSELASSGGGAVVEDPAQIFTSFTDRLESSFDPALVFLIVAAVCVLLDVAVRKFKFKWPHELIRDYREKKAQETHAQGDKQ